MQARLRALRAALLVLAGIALLAIFPATALPRRLPDMEGPPRSPSAADADETTSAGGERTTPAAGSS
ncbi:MAG TPA: hypothetical protein VH518_12100 [Tepidisphaeraceae bacterium]